jgi:cell division protein FtsW
MNRASKGSFANWWFTVDRVALLCICMLAGIGLMLAFAASPAITGGPLSAGDFRYTMRQVSFAMLALMILCGVSMLNLRQIRILAAVMFAGALIGSFLVLFIGADLLGAKREIDFGPIHLQPSEFLKPSFAILAAAVLSDRHPLPLPKPLITFFMLAPALGILLLQPDVVQQPQPCSASERRPRR